MFHREGKGDHRIYVHCIVYRNFHFNYAVFAGITNMVNSLWKTSPLSPSCEGGGIGVVISSRFFILVRI